MLGDWLLSKSRSPGSLIANSDYSCEAEILKGKIHLPAYYVLTALHVMCAIKLLHAVRIRVLILGGTSGGLDKYMADDAGYFTHQHWNILHGYVQGLPTS
jgi:hypothetical protein